MKDYCQSCLKWNDLDRAHIKSKGSGGTWEESNILLLCRKCHSEQHQIGWVKFSDKNPVLLKQLNKKGWIVKSFFGLRKLTKEDL